MKLRYRIGERSCPNPTETPCSTVESLEKLLEIARGAGPKGVCVCDQDSGLLTRPEMEKLSRSLNKLLGRIR